MSLRYSFRHLFYGGNVHKERLYKVLEDLDGASTPTDVSIDDLTDAEIVEAVITYTDDTTETVKLVVQKSSNSQ